MGEIKKIGDEYYIEFYARGLIYQQKAGTDFAVAQKMLTEVESKINLGEMGTITRDVDVDIFWKTFLDFAEKNHTPKSFERYEALIADFDEFLTYNLPKVKKFSQVTPSVVDHYQKYLTLTVAKNKPDLVNFSIFLLRDICEYAIKLGYINDNPTLHVRWLKSKSHRTPQCFKAEEMNRLLQESALPSLDQYWQEILKTQKWQSVVLRNTFVRNLLQKNVKLINIYQLLGFKDIARIMYYFPLIEEKDVRMF